MRRPALAAAALVLTAGAAIASEPEVFHVEDPARWGTPSVVVEPAYPKDAIARRLAGYVDVAGRVTAVGTIEDVELTPESAEHAVLADAVKAVLPDWRFYPHTGNDCQPTTEKARLRVWFSLEGDKPKVAFTRAALPQRKERRIQPVYRRHPDYPAAMQRAGYQSNVFARVEVARDGSVAAVTARAYPEDPGVDLTAFVRESERALRRWKFEPTPEGSRPPVVCYEIAYRLKG